MKRSRLFSTEHFRSSLGALAADNLRRAIARLRVPAVNDQSRGPRQTSTPNRTVMTQPISNLAQLLRAMEPIRNPGVYVFASLPHGSDVSALEPVVTVQEREGITTFRRWG